MSIIDQIESALLLKLYSFENIINPAKCEADSHTAGFICTNLDFRVEVYWVDLNDTPQNI